MKRLLAALALVALASVGHAQQLINCATSTPCVNNGPANTGTGDQLPTAGTKINNNFSALPAELFSGSPLSIAHGGTGATNFAAASLPVQSGSITSNDCVKWLNATTITDAGAPCGSGGGGTPGGSAFSIQYNNSGAFAGILPGATGVYCINWGSLSAAPTLTTSCGGTGGAAFNAITSGTNTTATMTVGTGASIVATGSGTITATGVPLSGVTGAGTGVITFLTTPNSANLLAAMTDETGTGNLVFNTSPTLVTPALKGSSTGTTTFASSNSGASNFTATFPANTGVVPELNLAQTWSAAQTYGTSQIILGGSSTGTTTFASANAGASNFTLTFPAITETLTGFTGSITSGHCAQFSGTAGTVVDSGSGCGASGAVSSVTAGTSGLVSSSPTTGAVVVDLAAIAANTVVANLTGSSAVPTAASMTALQAALIAANAQVCVPTANTPTGPTNDYSPTCSSGTFGATTAVLYLTPTSGGSTLNGLVAGSTMQQIIIKNAEAVGGTDVITLVNQSSSDTTAANRFSSAGNMAIPPGGQVSCYYFPSTISRWSCN